MQFHKSNKGFTLIELLVVIAIIGILSTLATVAVRYAIDKAKIAKAQHAIDAIYNAITMLGNDTNKWPGHQEVDTINAASGNEICGPDAATPPNICTYGLTDQESGIVADDTASPFNNWGGPYMSVISPDPWEHEYFFDTDYSIKNIDNTPCNCNNPGGSLSCHDVVVIGSYGPDGLGMLSAGANDYGCDDIIKIIIFQ